MVDLIQNRESGRSIRDKINAIIDGFNAGPYPFESRSALVEFAEDFAPKVGAIAHAGGLSYCYDGVSAAIADLPGWVPFGGLSSDHFKSATDTDDTASIQAAADYMILTGFDLTLPPRTLAVSDTIDLSAATSSVTIRGTRERTMLDFTPFGPAKSVIKFPRNEPMTIEGIEGVGNGNKNDPIFLDMPQSGRITMRDITLGSSGNTGIHATRVTNADWMGSTDLFFNGWQPLHKDVSSTITLTLTSGSANVTATESVFDAGDVGKDVIIFHHSDENAAFLSRIASVASGTSATLEDVMPESGTGRRFSFGPVTGTVTGTTLVLTRDVGLDANDVGRYIYLPRLGYEGKWHKTTIAAVSGSTVTLEEAPDTNGTIRVIFTPTVYLGREDGATNDIYAQSLLIEGYSGVGLIMEGTHIKIHELKTHGRAWGEFSNFGKSAEAIVATANRSNIGTWELEFCGAGYGGGVVDVCGGTPGVDFGYATVNAFLQNSHLIDFKPLHTGDCSLGVPRINSVIPWGRAAGLVKTTSAAADRRVNWNGRVTGRSSIDEMSVQGPSISGSVRAMPPSFINNGASIVFRPGSDGGVIIITATDTPNFHAIIAYYADGATVVAGPNASTTLGTSGKVNVSALGGALTIENLTGTGRRFHVSVLG